MPSTQTTPPKKSGASTAAAAIPSLKSSTAQPITVWLIEDNHTFRNTVARVLNQVPDLECSQHFPNSEEALEKLAAGILPDVVLVDVELPGLNGIEAVRRIKA